MIRLGRLSIHRPAGSMGNFAGWQYETGYWRWALYWEREVKGFGINRIRNIFGNNLPGRFGLSVTTPLGTVRLATQPPAPNLKKASTNV